MNAQQAKINAKESNRIAYNNQYEKIQALIKEASSLGKYEIWYYNQLNPDVKIQLNEDGFIVGKTQYERNEVMTKITW